MYLEPEGMMIDLERESPVIPLVATVLRSGIFTALVIHSL